MSTSTLLVALAIFLLGAAGEALAQDSCSAVSLSFADSSAELVGTAPPDDVVCYALTVPVGGTVRLEVVQGNNIIFTIVDPPVDAVDRYEFRSDRGTHEIYVAQLFRSITDEAYRISVGLSGERDADLTDRQTVTFVQQRLADLGYDPGPVDGVYGGKTAAAIAAFRQSRGLSGSGAIDDALVTALGAASQAEQVLAPQPALPSVGGNLDVTIIEHASDGQAASCYTATVSGLRADGDGFLAVRLGPGSQYGQFDELHNGDVVTVYDANGEWRGVMYGPSQGTCNYWEGEGRTRPLPYEGSKGWVHSNWLQVLAG